MHRSRAPGVVPVFFFLLLVSAAFAFRSLALSALALAYSGWMVVAHIPVWQKITKLERDVVLAGGCILICSLPIAAARSETAVIHFFVALLMLGSAYILSRDISVFCRASKWLLWLSIGAILLFLSQRGIAGFPLEEILPDSSSNGVTSYLVVLQANYCVLYFALKRRPLLVTPFLTLAICVVGYGRGSILASSAIVFLNGVAFLYPRTGLRGIVLAIVILLGCLYPVVKYSEAISSFVAANTKLGSGLYDYNRERAIKDYLSKIGPLELVVGASYRGTSIDSDYYGNPHNSYIRAHHIFGLPYLAMVIAFPWLLLRGSPTPGQKFFALGMVTVMLLRAFTEPILFPTLFDIFYFSSCFSLRAVSQFQHANGKAVVSDR